LQEKYSNAVISRDGKKVFEMGEDGKVKGEMEGFNVDERGYYEQMQKSDIFMENAELAFVGAFGQAYKYGTEEQKKELKKLSED